MTAPQMTIAVKKARTRETLPVSRPSLEGSTYAHDVHISEILHFSSEKPPRDVHRPPLGGTRGGEEPSQQRYSRTFRKIKSASERPADVPDATARREFQANRSFFHRNLGRTTDRCTRHTRKSAADSSSRRSSLARKRIDNDAGATHNTRNIAYNLTYRVERCSWKRLD